MAAAFASANRDAVRATFHSSVAFVSLVAGGAFFIFLAALQFIPIDTLLSITSIERHETQFIAIALILQVGLSVVGSVAHAGLSALGQYGLANLVDSNRILIEFSALIIGVGLFHARASLICLVFPVVSFFYVIALLILIYRAAPWLLIFPARVDRPTLMRMGMPMLGIAGMTFGYYGMTIQAPRIILANTLGPAAVTAYTVATMLMRLVRIPIDIPAHSATVELSLAHGVGQRTLAQNLVLQTTRVCIWMAIFFLPIVLLTGPKIVQVWSNGRVSITYPLLLILSCSTAFFSLGLPSQEALMALNKLNDATRWLVFAVPANLFLLWYFSIRLGLPGTGLAVLLTDIAYAILSVYFVGIHFRISASVFARSLSSPPTTALVRCIKRMYS